MRIERMKILHQLTEFEKAVYVEISKLIGVPLNYSSIEIAINEKYQESQRVAVYQMRNNSLIVTVPSLYERLLACLAEKRLETRVSLDRLRSLMGLESHRIESNTIYTFQDPSDYREISLGNEYTIAPIDNSHQKQFRVFTRECSKEELDEGSVSLEDPVVYGCFFQDTLVGVTSFWLWKGRIADIGIVIHPDHRRRSIGKALVSTLCNWGINNGRINLYRHDENNIASNKLALSCNFKPHLVVEEMLLKDS